MTTHTRNNVQNLTGQLYFVCQRCWIYLCHVSNLHEPCHGCALLESSGWDFWTPGQGRSAWWRHPGWMFMPMLFHFNRYSLDPPACDDFQKLAHPSQTLYCRLSRMVQLTPFVQTKPLNFFTLHSRMGFNRVVLYTVLPGRDTTRASHTSHLSLSCFFFVFPVIHWTVRHRLVRSNGRVFLIQFASWI